MTETSATPSAVDKKRARAAQARALLERLAARYPDCFTRNAEKIRPLAIGIQQKLRAELAEDPEFQDVPGWQIRQALAIYTRSLSYLKALIEGRPRVNLDGSTAGEVTAQEQAHAQARFDEINAIRAARRVQQPKRPAARRKPAAKRPARKEPSQRKLEQLAAKFSRR
ncbi:MAG: prop expression regulator [Xanthomonadaceae bacterium]|nr:prop expression regulator [Xanthomonadaceae bacterium]